MTTLTRVLLAWMLAGISLTACVSRLAPELLQASMVISITSGLISAIALLPGLLLSRDATTRRSQAGVFMVACVAAMTIRTTGTVALLVACGYQMVIPLQTLAFFVCGWYVLLTSIEIIWLAKGASRFDQHPVTHASESSSVSHPC
ncbi:MAG: hypothetical protein AB8B91_02180 [Rubripirellula sp.]